MENQIFRVSALKKLSFMQRITRQLPTENALLELNNLLASRLPQSILPEELGYIEDRYRISLKKEYGLNLQEFYAVLLNAYLLEDTTLGNGRKETLAHLSMLFELDTRIVAYIELEIGKLVYQRYYLQAISDNRISEVEEKQLDELQNRLRLPKEVAEKVSFELRTRHVTRYFDRMVGNRRISPAEDQEFLAMTKSLKINPQIKPEVKDVMAWYRYFWGLENEPLKEHSVGIEIQKSEACYLKINKVDYYEPRSMRSSYGGSYNALIDSGMLYLTQKRILHSGIDKSRSIKFDSIVRLEKIEGGVYVQKLTGKHVTLKMHQYEAEALDILLKRLGKKS